MLSFSRTTRVFLATQPTDLRKGFDGLFALVENMIQEDPFSGHLFVFRNRARDRLKVLWWDRDGLAVFYKRLERGTFSFPAATGDVPQIEMTGADLQLILQGIDPAKVQRSKRYQRPAMS